MKKVLNELEDNIEEQIDGTLQLIQFRPPLIGWVVSLINDIAGAKVASADRIGMAGDESDDGFESSCSYDLWFWNKVHERADSSKNHT